MYRILCQGLALAVVAGSTVLPAYAADHVDETAPPAAPTGLQQVEQVIEVPAAGPIVERCVPQHMYHQQSTLHGVPTDQLLRLRGGLSYYDHPRADSKVGGTYGLDGIVPLSESFGGYGAGKLNHFSGGTQSYASIGLYRMASACADHGLDRVGGGVFYDWFSDSRGNDLDLTMYRFYLGYAVTENWSVGVRYIEPGEDEDNPLYFRSNSQGAIGDFYMTQEVATYLSGYVGENLVSLALGYRDQANTTYVDASLRRPVARNLNAFIDTHYEDRGGWAVITGLEFRFGRGGSSCGCGPRVRTPWDDPTIADAFNWGEARTMGTVVNVDEKEPEFRVTPK